MNNRLSSAGFLSYGLLGWALGAVAVPIYIQVPYLYSRVLEVPSAWVGIILMLSRLVDAVVDPLLGHWIDHRACSGNRYKMPIVWAVPFLLVGMLGVFFPLGHTPVHYAINLMVALVLVHLGYSLASIAYQAWGAELGQTDKERSTFVAVREGLGILGVVFAVSLSLETHAPLLYGGFASLLLIGVWVLLRKSPQPGLVTRTSASLSANLSQVLAPMRQSNFRQLIGVFFCNGFAAALPATLVPFFMRDRLGLSDSDQWVLAVYFLVGALSTVGWVSLAGRWGLVKTWLLGMVISVPAFVWVVLLERGDLWGYLAVCVLTGVALGADLSMPAALVARIIQANGQQGQAEGTYFGLWNWVNKLNLALAPSLALGVLQWFAYTPNAFAESGLQGEPFWSRVLTDPLLWVYALVPCLLKIGALLLLQRAKLFDEER